MKTKPETQLDAGWDASRLRAAVEAAGLDPVELAVWLRQRSGIKRLHPGSVRYWLVGKHQPNATMFVLMCERVGLDPREALGLPPAGSTSTDSGSARRARRSG